jgi:hypothetical protein
MWADGLSSVRILDVTPCLSFSGHHAHTHGVAAYSWSTNAGHGEYCTSFMPIPPYPRAVVLHPYLRPPMCQHLHRAQRPNRASSPAAPPDPLAARRPCPCLLPSALDPHILLKSNSNSDGADMPTPFDLDVKCWHPCPHLELGCGRYPLRRHHDSTPRNGRFRCELKLKVRIYHRLS